MNDDIGVKLFTFEASGYPIDQSGHLTSEAWELCGLSGRIYYDKDKNGEYKKFAFTSTISEMETSTEVQLERMKVISDPTSYGDNITPLAISAAKNTTERTNITKSIKEDAKKIETIKINLYDYVLKIYNDLLYGNIGDSSGYVIKNKKLHKVTKDHTLVNLLVSTGELTEEEAKYHPRRNVLMRALGANNPIDIDIFDVDTNISGILLCSDGLTNMLTDEQIEKVLDSNLTLKEILEKLIRKANARGGNDNISIAYLKKESGDV